MMNTTNTTPEPTTSAPWTVARIFKATLAVTLGVLAALALTFALLALLFA